MGDKNEAATGLPRGECETSRPEESNDIPWLQEATNAENVAPAPLNPFVRDLIVAAREVQYRSGMKLQHLAPALRKLHAALVPFAAWKDDRHPPQPITCFNCESDLALEPQIVVTLCGDCYQELKGVDDGK
jgi:hypothetical protein